MARPLNIAHRGARSLAPENTLAAARAALAVGADMWELDVSVSADGELVIMHDDTLTRTTDAARRFPHRRPWAVRDFTLAEIKQLDTGAVFLADDPFGQLAAGHISAEARESFRGEPVPTLREALEFTRAHGWQVNVELKALLPPQHTFPIARQVVALIEELEMAAAVLVSSFVPLYLTQVRELNPAIPVAVLTSGPLSNQERAEIEALIGEISPLHYFAGANPAQFLAEVGSQVYHPYYTMLTEAELSALQANGIAVNVWTVNDRADMARLTAAGVHGIITDFPQTLQEIVAQHPHAAAPA